VRWIGWAMMMAFMDPERLLSKIEIVHAILS